LLPRTHIPTSLALAGAAVVALAPLSGWSLAQDEDEEDALEDEEDEGPDADVLEDEEEGEEQEEYEEPRKVVAIEIEENRRVSEADVLKHLVTKKGQLFSPEKIKQDIQKLYALGYFSNIRVERFEEEGGWRLVYVLTENPAVHEVRFEGNKKIKKSKIEEVIDIKPNSVLSVPKIKKNVDKIHDLYVEKGYFLADVTFRLEDLPKHQVDVVFEIVEHDKVLVRQIRFSGNSALSDKELRRVMSTKQENVFSFLSDAGNFKPEDLERDLMILTAYYYDKGYLAVQVGEPLIEFSADHKAIDITVPIEEGPRYRVGQVGVKEVDDEGGEIEPLGGRKKVMGLIGTKQGEWFSRSVVGEDLTRLEYHYKNAGYANVNIDPRWKPREDELIVDIIFVIQRGEIVHIGKILIMGNEKTRDKVIRREMVIDEGDIYNQSDIDESKSRVTALGYFERVDQSSKQGSSPDTVDLVFEVKERPTGTFQVGAGLSSVENFIFTAQISHDNFLGRGQSIALMAQISALRQIFTLSFFEPYFLDSRWFMSFNLFSNMREYWDFRRESFGGGFTFGYPILRDLRLSLGYQLEKVNVTTRPSASLFGYTSGFFQDLPLANLFNDGWTSSVRVTLSYDTRNNRLFPSKGTYNSASIEWATKYLGSQTNFLRYNLISRWYFPLGLGFVLKFNAEWGLITSLDPKGVPIYERYFLGGIFDVRGYRRWTISPRLNLPESLDPNAAPSKSGGKIGGNMMMLLQAELEFPIIEAVGIRGVIFFDAGNAFNMEDSYCQFSSGHGINVFTDPCNRNPFILRTSVGVGFRWFSPIGPLRFEWGFPLKRYEGEEPMVFEFTIGNPF
jgi:outer membrane protein insertion porin family